MSGYSQMSGYSTMSSLDGGLSREDRQHSADGAGWGRLSGVNTPGGYHTPSRCCSEAQTPHGFDADRAAVLREGSAAATGGEPGAWWTDSCGFLYSEQLICWRASLLSMKA
jgi:hypothetical protein